MTDETCPECGAPRSLHESIQGLLDDLQAQMDERAKGFQRVLARKDVEIQQLQEALRGGTR